MTVNEVLDRLLELGVTASVNGGKIQLRPGSQVPSDLLGEVKEHKLAILSSLQRRTDLIDLPWPVGYGGLPADEVARAEATNDRLGATDPVNRRLNVWMWSHFRDHGDTEMASEMREEYHRLRHAQPAIQELCGLCEYQDETT